VPFFSNSDTRTFVTCEGEQSLLGKARLVLDRGLAGMMFREYRSDDGRLLDAIGKGLAGKRPSRCGAGRRVGEGRLARLR